MDNIETIIQVVFVIIFVFGQFLFRLFVKGMKGRVDKGTVQPMPTVPDELPVAPETVNEDRTVEKPKPLRKSKRGRTNAESEAALLRKASASVLARLNLQQDRLKMLVTASEYRNYHVLSGVLSEYVSRIQRIIDQFDEASDQKKMPRSLVEDYNQAIQVLEDRLVFFDGVLNERSASFEKQYNTADMVAENLCFRYRHGHPNGEQYFKNMIGLVVGEQNTGGGGLYGIPTPAAFVKSPRAWSAISYTVAKTVVAQGRMATKVAAELGLPAALTSMSYFLSSGRLMSAGLVSAWMPWLMADVAATLQMGLAYGWVLLDECESVDDSNSLSVFSIDKRGAVSSMPTLARMVAVYAVLQKMAVFDLELLTDRVSRLFTQNSVVKVDIAGRGAIPISLDGFRSDLESVAIALVDTPLSVLGQFSFDELVGTDFSPTRQAFFGETAEQLRRGHSVSDCTPVEIAIAASLAVHKERNAESRIESAALKSLSGKKQRLMQHRASASIPGTSPSTLADVFSPQYLPGTVMVGAIARGRGGLVTRQ
ncbi:MAG: hypothetical protein JXX29_08530 [Deltaproteobacteria bacterium]|nr:hypothetical protein [Deltaproteobacteria bacterium]MBN2671707.1 hypothetical protein [Deltaproteobacteria bacterium]